MIAELRLTLGKPEDMDTYVRLSAASRRPGATVDVFGAQLTVTSSELRTDLQPPVAILCLMEAAQ